MIVRKLFQQTLFLTQHNNTKRLLSLDLINTVKEQKNKFLFKTVNFYFSQKKQHLRKKQLQVT